MNPPSLTKNKRGSRFQMEYEPTLNEFGLPIPSKNIYNYTPDVMNTANLISADYNFLKDARKKRNNALSAYKNARKTAKNKRNSNKTRKNNTKKKLFNGGR